MTKEQEAIEMLEDIKNNTWTTKYIMSSDSKKAETALNMLKEKDKLINEQLKENIKKEREIMPYLPHKSALFHYANGREVLAKEILEFIEGEKKQ